MLVHIPTFTQLTNAFEPSSFIKPRKPLMQSLQLILTAFFSIVNCHKNLNHRPIDDFLDDHESTFPQGGISWIRVTLWFFCRIYGNNYLFTNISFLHFLATTSSLGFHTSMYLQSLDFQMQVPYFPSRSSVCYWGKKEGKDWACS